MHEPDDLEFIAGALSLAEPDRLFQQRGNFAGYFRAVLHTGVCRSRKIEKAGLFIFNKRADVTVVKSLAGGKEPGMDKDAQETAFLSAAGVPVVHLA